jgi:hypothetical protein
MIEYLTALSAVASEPALISKMPIWLVAVPIRFSIGTVAEAVLVALVKSRPACPIRLRPGKSPPRTCRRPPSARSTAR